MSKNNPFSDREFFKNYINARKQKNNYNDLLEQPVVFSLLDNVMDKTILDVGCGYGAMDNILGKLGAKSVLGVDLSEAMIEKAIVENSHPNVKYMLLDVKYLLKQKSHYDIVISSLYFHYMKDFDKLFENVASVLKKKGTLIFSIDHPIATASKYEQEWIYEPDGSYRAFVMDNYESEGERVMEWLERPVMKYHHKMETIINALIGAGFNIVKIVEPCPTPTMQKENPKMDKELHRPVFLMVKCIKK